MELNIVLYCVLRTSSLISVLYVEFYLFLLSVYFIELLLQIKQKSGCDDIIIFFRKLLKFTRTKSELILYFIYLIVLLKKGDKTQDIRSGRVAAIRDRSSVPQKEKTTFIE